MTTLQLRSDCTALCEAAQELADILHITLSDDGFPVDIIETDNGLFVKFEADHATIGYHKRAEFFRALGLLVENFETKTDVEEHPLYSELSVMYDCSRNAVPTVESVKRRIRHLALMGYTSLLLYTEDTYEVDGYPYFGYMRGRYTKDELREIDDYADRFGLELIPCIQVLAHLRQALKWIANRPMRDIDDILLVGEPKTYDLIASMLKTCSECFRTKRIHIGMDEAWNLGNGAYFKQNGYHDHTEIIATHFDKVMQMLREGGFQPMMWSDMLFSAAFNRNNYYYAATLEYPHMPQDVIDTVPKEMELIYWDYGNSYKTYHTMARLHTEFRNPIWFAGGATIWGGYAPMNQFSLRTSRDAIRACRENGIDKMMVTAWGDNGQECPHMATFPTLQMFAEDCYENNNTDEFVAKRFTTCVDGNYEDFLMLDTVNFAPGNPAPGCGTRNPCKYLLHQDVLIGLFDKHQTPEFPAHFADRAVALREAGTRNPRWQYMFDTLADLCHVLAVKADVGVRAKQAYDANDRAALADIADVTVPDIQKRLAIFIQTFGAQWMTDNKVFGLDVMDIRFGGLQRRLEAAVERIHAYLEGRVDSLPEFEQERLYWDGNNAEDRNPNICGGIWGNIVTGCALNEI